MSAPDSPQGIPDSGEKRIGFLQRYRVAFQIVIVVITAGTVSLIRDWRAERNAIVAREKQQTDFRDAVRFAKDVRNNAFFRIEPDDDRDFLAALASSRRILAADLGMKEEELLERFNVALRDAPNMDGGLAAVPHLQFALGDTDAPRPWSRGSFAERRREKSDRAQADPERLILIGDSEFASRNSRSSTATYLAACEKIGSDRSHLWEQAHVRLAISYDRHYRPEKSAEIWREIVAFRIKDTHSRSPGTETAKRWLATMLWESGKPEEAEPLMRQPPVFDGHKSLLARPRSLNDRMLIVSLLEDNGHDDEALRYASKTRDHFHKHRETQPMEFSKLLATIGRIHWRQEHRALAEPYLRNALYILGNQPSPDMNTRADALGSLGGLLAEIGKTEEAAALFARARDIHQNAPGGPHPDLAIDLYRLGDALRAPERQQEAGDLIRQGIEGLKDRKKYDRFYLAEAHWFLARWHQRNGRIEEAKDEARKAIGISTDAEGAEHGRTMKYRKYLDGLAGKDGKEGEK